MIDDSIENQANGLEKYVKVINSNDIELTGMTIVDKDNYKNDKIISKNKSIIINADEKYYRIRGIPPLNKINENIYDSLYKGMHTKRVGFFLVDGTCIFGYKDKYSKSIISEDGTQYWFCINIDNYGLGIRDSKNVYCKYEPILWTEKKVGIAMMYENTIQLHISKEEVNSELTNLEDLREYYSKEENKFNIYYELKQSIQTEIENEVLLFSGDIEKIYIYEDFLNQEEKQIKSTINIREILKKALIDNRIITSYQRFYYASEFGCSYSKVNSTCTGKKGEKKIYVKGIETLDFEVGQGIAIENSRYVRTDELSWLCALIIDIDYVNQEIIINRALQEDVVNGMIEHDNYFNYLKINNFFIDKNIVNLKFETGEYINHELRSILDTPEKIAKETGIKLCEDPRIMIYIDLKSKVDIDFCGSIFIEKAKYNNRIDYNYGGNRCGVLAHSFIQIRGSENVQIKNGTVMHDCESNCINTGIRTLENMGDGFLIHGCRNVLLDNLEAYGCESDGFALGGSARTVVGEEERGNQRIILRNCRAYYCGRQGLTFSSGTDCIIEQCEFSYTGYCKDKKSYCWWGCRNPGAGIDFEFESNSDDTTGWDATSAIRRVVIRDSKIIGNLYTLANGMTEGNFLIENSILLAPRNADGVFFINTGVNAGFTIREDEDEGEKYEFGSMQPMTFIMRDCLIDAKGMRNASSFGYFRRVIIDSCILRDFNFNFGGRQVSITNSELQYSLGKRSMMLGNPRFPGISNCTIRFKSSFIDKYDEWNWSPIYGQFENCVFFLEEPTIKLEGKKILLIDFGQNSKRNYVYPAAAYDFDGVKSNPIIKELTTDWGLRDVYEVYSQYEFNVLRIYRKKIIVSDSIIVNSSVNCNFIIDNKYSQDNLKIIFRNETGDINHIITVLGGRKPSFKKITMNFWTVSDWHFPDGSRNYEYKLPQDDYESDLVFSIKYNEHFKYVDISQIKKVDSQFNPIKHVSGITIDKVELELDLNKKSMDTLIANVLPLDATNKNIIWSTSDKLIAKVEGGKITALKKGECIITAATVEGNYTITCLVNVIDIRDK